MFKLFFRKKEKKIPPIFFISASIGALIMLPLFFIYLNSFYDVSAEIKKIEKQSSSNNGKYYDLSDPYITKVIDSEDAIKKPQINPTDPSIGATNAPITIIEFSDFSCEFCQKQEKIIRQIIEDFKGKINLVWKDFPESNNESPSFRAALAARCAAEQEKFWPFHDLLFEKNSSFDEKFFAEIAKKTNLKLKKFNDCLASNEAKKLVEDNIREANNLKIPGIPFIYLNGKEFLGEISYEELKKIIELEEKK